MGRTFYVTTSIASSLAISARVILPVHLIMTADIQQDNFLIGYDHG